MGLLRRKVHWRLIIFLAIFYLVFEIFYTLKMYYIQLESGNSMPLYAYGAFFLDWILVTLYMSLISVHTSYLLQHQKPWKIIIPIHLFLSVLISVVIRMVVDLYLVFLGVIDKDIYSYEDFIDGIIYNLDVNYLIYSAMIFVIYAFHYLEAVKSSEQQKNILEKQLLDAKVKMLTTQLQPHFLFNTLNSISSLIDIDKAKAQDTIADLSDFLRQILYHIDSNFVSVQKEISILDPYLNILRTRFYGKIKIKVTVQEDLLQTKIPALILQPIVENAVKHGSFSQNAFLMIKINIYSKGKELVIQVMNSGRLKPSSGNPLEKGMGLTNLRTRLRDIYGESADFRISNSGEESVSCTVSIPHRSLSLM